MSDTQKDAAGERLGPSSPPQRVKVRNLRSKTRWKLYLVLLATLSALGPGFAQGHSLGDPGGTADFDQKLILAEGEQQKRGSQWDLNHGHGQKSRMVRSGARQLGTCKIDWKNQPSPLTDSYQNHPNNGANQVSDAFKTVNLELKHCTDTDQIVNAHHDTYSGSSCFLHNYPNKAFVSMTDSQTSNQNLNIQISYAKLQDDGRTQGSTSCTLQRVVAISGKSGWSSTYTLTVQLDIVFDQNLEGNPIVSADIQLSFTVTDEVSSAPEVFTWEDYDPFDTLLITPNMANDLEVQLSPMTSPADLTAYVHRLYQLSKDDYNNLYCGDVKNLPGNCLVELKEDGLGSGSGMSVTFYKNDVTVDKIGHSYYLFHVVSSEDAGATTYHAMKSWLFTYADPCAQNGVVITYADLGQPTEIGCSFNSYSVDFDQQVTVTLSPSDYYTVSSFPSTDKELRQVCRVALHNINYYGQPITMSQDGFIQIHASQDYIKESFKVTFELWIANKKIKGSYSFSLPDPELILNTGSLVSPSNQELTLFSEFLTTKIRMRPLFKANCDSYSLITSLEPPDAFESLNVLGYETLLFEEGAQSSTLVYTASIDDDLASQQVDIVVTVVSLFDDEYVKPTSISSPDPPLDFTVPQLVSIEPIQTLPRADFSVNYLKVKEIIALDPNFCSFSQDCYQASHPIQPYQMYFTDQQVGETFAFDQLDRLVYIDSETGANVPWTYANGIPVCNSYDPSASGQTVEFALEVFEKSFLDSPLEVITYTCTYAECSNQEAKKQGFNETETWVDELAETVILETFEIGFDLPLAIELPTIVAYCPSEPLTPEEQLVSAYLTPDLDPTAEWTIARLESYGLSFTQSTESRATTLHVETTDTLLIGSFLELTLKEGVQSEPGWYKLTHLTLSFTGELPVLEPIIELELELSECFVEKVSFDSSSYLVSYEVGSGPVTASLPSHKQEPDCGLPFTDFAVVSQLGKGASSVAFDAASLSVTIDSEDFSLVGKSAELTIETVLGPEQQDLQSTNLIVTVLFDVGPPQFDLSDLQIDPLTCSIGDASWSLKLPKLVMAEIQTADFAEAQDPSDLFELASESGVVFLKSAALQKLVKGQDCPETATVSITIEIDSDPLGKATHEFLIPVEPTESSGFAGVTVSSDEQATGSFQKEPEPLKINQMEMSQDGMLTISFNKDIIEPNISVSRQLSQYTIEDFLRVEVKDGDEDEAQNKQICDLSLSKVHEKALEVSIGFCEPSNVSQDVTQPDVIKVYFMLPRLIMDAETFDVLSQDEIIFEQPIVKQMSKEALAQLEAITEKAANIGKTLSIWQLLICLLSGKALKSMWIMINALQFLVFMSFWRINFPQAVGVAIGELKRVALGEFFDDVEFGDQLLAKIGFEKKEESQESQSDLGFTLIIGTVILLILLIGIVIAILLFKCVFGKERRVALSNKLKLMLFYNPLIRYVLLNALKLFFTALVVFQAASGGATLQESEQKGKAQSYVLLSLLSALPFFLALVLFLNRRNLDQEGVRKKIGSLYLGRNTVDSRKSTIWILPLTFFVRRLIFICTTVFLVAKPGSQMLIHQVMTLLTLVYISVDPRMFESQAQKAAEIATEFLLLLTSALIQQCMRDQPTTASLGKIQSSIFVTIGLILVLNVVFLVRTILQNRRNKKRIQEMIALHKRDIRRKKLREGVELATSPWQSTNVLLRTPMESLLEQVNNAAQQEAAARKQRQEAGEVDDNSKTRFLQQSQVELLVGDSHRVGPAPIGSKFNADTIFGDDQGQDDAESEQKFEPVRARRRRPITEQPKQPIDLLTSRRNMAPDQKEEEKLEQIIEEEDVNQKAKEDAKYAEHEQTMAQIDRLLAQMALEENDEADQRPQAEASDKESAPQVVSQVAKAAQAESELVSQSSQGGAAPSAVPAISNFSVSQSSSSRRSGSSISDSGINISSIMSSFDQASDSKSDSSLGQK